jgi:hypothetical protein
MNTILLIILIFVGCFLVIAYLMFKAPVYNDNEQPLMPVQKTKHEEEKSFWKNKELREKIERDLEEKRYNCKNKKREKPVIKLRPGLWQKIKSKTKYKKAI